MFERQQQRINIGTRRKVYHSQINSV